MIELSLAHSKKGKKCRMSGVCTNVKTSFSFEKGRLFLPGSGRLSRRNPNWWKKLQLRRTTDIDKKGVSWTSK